MYFVKSLPTLGASCRPTNENEMLICLHHPLPRIFFSKPLYSMYSYSLSSIDPCISTALSPAEIYLNFIILGFFKTQNFTNHSQAP